MIELINHYDASHIQVLEGLEALRKRPAKFIGDFSIKGLHYLVGEVVDSCIDKALAGYCNDYQEIILADNVIKEVDDNSHVVSVAMHQSHKHSALELVMGVLHYDDKSYKTCRFPKACSNVHCAGSRCTHTLSPHLDYLCRKDRIDCPKPTKRSSCIDLFAGIGGFSVQDPFTENITILFANETAYYAGAIIRPWERLLLASTTEEVTPSEERRILNLYKSNSLNLTPFKKRGVASGGIPLKDYILGETVSYYQGKLHYILLIPKIINANEHFEAVINLAA